jgi:lysophospholipase L1-like esterase
VRAAARSSPRAWVLLLVVALLGACGKSTPPLPKLGAGDVVLAFGDSLTFGTGAREAESYPAVLAVLIGRRVVREGFPGEGTEQGVERLPALLDEHRPRLLLLCMGGNDMLHKVDPAATETNLRAMVRQARERGIAVVLIGVPKPQLFGGVADFYGKVAGDYGIPLEDSVLKDVLYDNAFKSDPIHPNAQGYRKLAEALAALLRKAGAL